MRLRWASGGIVAPLWAEMSKTLTDGTITLNGTLLLLLAALAAAPITVAAGAVRPLWTTPVAIVTSALAFLAALSAVIAGGSRWESDWIPTWDLRLAFAADGLARLYALLATGIGLLVTCYAGRYLPLHLAHHGRAPGELVRFFGLLLLFMGAMVGLVLAQGLVLLFLFWDLTAVASYFLIGYDRDEESRRSALMALLVTGVSAVLVLLGFVVLGQVYDTDRIPELLSIAAASPRSRLAEVATALVLIGALAKSAQVPLHFWLPRAMAAPTPVSAYLHSAAMVAAGVFLIGRLYPLIARTPWLLDALLIVGLLSMAVGGLLALTRDVLKQVLAYSTISQYGYVVTMFGLGGEHGVAGATFYVLAHAVAKSALFLSAGAVTEATGEQRLARIGGLALRMPVLAAASGAAASALAALPLTVGFFKDELFFAAAREHGPLMTVAAVIGAALTFAYIGRFWAGIFLGRARTECHDLPPALIWPVVVLAGLALAGGVWTAPFVAIAEGATAVSLHHDVEIAAAYHLDLRAENVMAVATWALGGALLATRRVWWPLTVGVARLGERFGPARLYAMSIGGLNALSGWLHRIEVRDLRGRVTTVLFPAGVLVGIAMVTTPTVGQFRVGPLPGDALPLAFVISVAALSGIIVTIARDHLRIALTLSCVGYSLAVVYAFLGAPDVALVAVLIETIFALLFLGMLTLMPNTILHFEMRRSNQRPHEWRDLVLGLTAGGLAFLVVWGALSRPAAPSTVVGEQIAQTPLAHGGDVVTTILADFRGFDTLGEVTVILIVLLGVMRLLRRSQH